MTKLQSFESWKKDKLRKRIVRLNKQILELEEKRDDLIRELYNDQ